MSSEFFGSDWGILVVWGAGLGYFGGVGGPSEAGRVGGPSPEISGFPLRFKMIEWAGWRKMFFDWYLNEIDGAIYWMDGVCNR